MTWRRFLLAMLLCAPRMAVAQSPPTLELSFLPDAIEVSHLTAGGKVVWFGASQEIADDEVPEIRAYAMIVEDEDHDGVGRIELPKGVPLHSTWVAVDLSTGAVVAGAPAGYPLRSIPWNGQGIQFDESGDSVADARQTGNLLVVRPGVGAWLVESGDGGPADLDAEANGVLQLAFAELEALGDTTAAAPMQLASGDVVAMLDPRLLELTLTTVAQ